HATLSGLSKLPIDVKNVLVMYGDDFSYPKEKIHQLITKHLDDNAMLTLLTINKDNPYGLGRIIRDENGKVLRIVEEKDATDEERKIKEINPGCYIFNRMFLKKYLPKIKKSPVTGEYYLTSIIDLAIKNNEKIETIKAGNIPWQGVNTKEDLEEAQKLFVQQ
ncbi:MAG TPA: sugar phosphate nucleotidyltransferase, partial [Patescibacteria group bacterium]